MIQFEYFMEKTQHVTFYVTPCQSQGTTVLQFFFNFPTNVRCGMKKMLSVRITPFMGPYITMP